MADRLIQTETLTAIADAIRAKNGTSDTYTPPQMALAIMDIETGDSLLQSDIPSFVKEEALTVAKRAQAVQNANTVTFLTLSDSHHAGTQETGLNKTNINNGNLHAAQAAKILSYALPIDFAAFLGDATYGSTATTLAQLKDQIEEINGWLSESFRGVPQFRTPGNHDTGEYNVQPDAAYLFTQFGAFNDGATYGSEVFGYCYRDFADKKLRVICLNSEEGEIVDGRGTNWCYSEAQLLWFAQTLRSVGAMEGWTAIVIEHYPLDYGSGAPSYGVPPSNIVYQYIQGGSVTYSGTTVNFSGANNATVLNIHGHTHCFKVDNLRYISGNVGTPFDVKRVAVPNMMFYRNNEYGENGQTEDYGIEFGETSTYPKTAGGAKDTAFCLNVLDLSEKVLYSFCYGAGYDRVVSLDATVYRLITKNLTNVSINSDIASVEDGTPYTAILTANSGYEIHSVSISMGGVDITSSAYNSSTGAISIASVTGDVVITATAEEAVPYHNLIPTATNADGTPYYTNGYRQYYVLSSSGVDSENGGSKNYAVGFIPYNGETIRIKNMRWSGYGDRICAYDSSHQPIASARAYNSTSYLNMSTDPDTGVTTLTFKNAAEQAGAYIRISTGSADDPTAMVLTLNEPIE